MKKEVYYFEKTGQENTEACVQAVLEAITRDGYKHVVVATTGGDTGVKFAEALKETGVLLVAVTHSSGFREPNTLELKEENRERLKALGVKLYTGTILTHSVETSLNQKFGGIYPGMIIAQSLRRFGEGAKVACEITMMACDAGLLPEGEEVLAVAGTAWGADTVLVVKSAASKRFLELRVLEVLAKPRV